MTMENRKGSQKLPFVMMVKPVGSLCNMHCDYCYYLDTEYESHLPAFRMTESMLETLIRRVAESSPGPVISLTWHGGEPAAAGLSFYQKVVALEKQYQPEGFTFTNNLQTNGTLLDDAFCRFLAENHFDVGLSLDGCRSVHDSKRHMADGSPTYDQVYAAARRLMDVGIQPDLLCTVHAGTVSHAKEIYQNLRDLGTGWMQFIPIVNHDENGHVTEESVSAEAYGEFLKDVFSEWFYHDLGRTNVQLFAETAKVLAGGEASLCTLAPVCGQVLVAEHDGSIYSCDHFVDHHHYLGNIETADLQMLLTSDAQQAFGRAKMDALTKQCRECPYLSLCRGGCLKDRHSCSKYGEPGHDDLCKGLYSFYSYAVPRLKQAMALSSQHVAGEALQKQLVFSEREAARRIGRNDPCPCGSGRKFKSCCLRRVP